MPLTDIAMLPKTFQYRPGVSNLLVYGQLGEMGLVVGEVGHS